MKKCFNKIIWTLSISVLSTLTMQGCTTKLTAIKVPESANDIEGQVYYLPKTSYQVQLDRELKSCSMEYDNDMLAAQEWLREQADRVGSFADRNVKKVGRKYKEIIGLANNIPGQEGKLDKCNVDYLHKYINDDNNGQEAQDLKTQYDDLISTAEREFIQGKIRDAGAEYNKILTDDVLKKPYVDKYIASFLAEEWKEKYAPNACDIDGLKQFFKGDASAPYREELQLKLSTAMKAQLSQTALSDPDHIYSIHYEGLSRGIKNTDFSVETYPNGTLKSVNVTLKDQTGELVESVIQGAVKISSAASGIPLGLVPQKGVTDSVMPYAEWLENQQQGASLCSAKTRLRLAQRSFLKALNDSLALKNLIQMKEVTQQQELISKLEGELAEKKRKLESLEESDPEHAALTDEIQKHIGVIAAAKVSLAELELSLEQLANGSSEAADAFGKIRKSLTTTVVTDFVPEAAKWGVDANGKKVITESPEISSAIYGADIALQAWFDAKKVNEFCEDDSLCSNGLPKSALASLYAEVTLHPSLTKVGSLPQPDTGSIVYRQPVRSPLWVCKEKPCFDPVKKTMVEQKDILLSSSVDVPQLGVLASLPLANGPFQNNTLVASFSENGALTELSYTTNAAAVSASETFTQSADTFLEYRKARLEEPKAKIDRAKVTTEANTELLEAQLEELKAQSALDDYLGENAD